MYVVDSYFRPFTPEAIFYIIQRGMGAFSDAVLRFKRAFLYFLSQFIVLYVLNDVLGLLLLAGGPQTTVHMQ